MGRRALRFRVLGDDLAPRLEVVDPGLDLLPLLHEIEPGFAVRTAPLPVAEPRWWRLRGAATGVAAAGLGAAPEEALWAAHDAALAAATAAAPRAAGRGEAELGQLTAALARRLLRRCVLCARRCGVDRTQRPAGACRLGPVALAAEHFVHVAEEAEINPSYVVSLSGCALRCVYCQQAEQLDPAAPGLEPLGGLRLDAGALAAARTLSFAGGNPDESLPAVLAFLLAAPAELARPVVWNTHAYSSPEVLRLLRGVVDVYLPDLKYGSGACGLAASGVPGYPEVALRAIAAMAASAPTIVRMLVLPGHFACCHAPALRILAAVDGDVRLSIRGQYAPDHRALRDPGPLGRRAARDEVEAVRQLAADLRIPICAPGAPGP